MIAGLLRLCAAHARLLMVAGLAAGVALPGVAAAMAPWLPQMVAVLLVATAFRIGHRAAFGAVRDLAWIVPAVLVLQLAVPLAILAALWGAGLADTGLGFAVVLTAAAPTIAGSGSIAIVLRQDPARMMQLLVVGTALFPVTALPVLAAFPGLQDPGVIAAAAGRALAVILGTSALGFALRHWLLPQPDAGQIRAMDGAAVLIFVVVVVGLMAAMGPALRADPGGAFAAVAAAVALSFGLQAAVLGLMRGGALAAVAGPLALAAGTRNLALFLVALPAEVMAPAMLFVAAWQLPMYLTPVLLPRLYARLPAHG